MKYSQEHIWIKNKGNRAEFGITSEITENYGDVVYVEMPEVGEIIEQGEVLFSVEFTDNQMELPSPLSGIVTQCNEELEDDVEVLNEECEGTFIVKMKLTDMDQLEELLSTKQYRDYCK